MSAAPMTKPGRVIAIASGKGGVGKTWLAITLAQALAQAGRRVVLMDADLGLANVDVQLGLKAGMDLGSVVAGAPPEQAAIPLPAGFHLLPGRSGTGALAGLSGAALEAATSLPRRLAAGWQEVVVDIGAGVEAPQRRLAAQADLLLVVATEEPTSLTDAYAVLKLHAQDAPRAEARLVVNLAAGAASGQATHATLDAAARRFLGRAVPLAGVIRRDAKVPDAIRHQTPLLTRHPGSAAAKDVAALARGLG
ncbi:nucleotide-binding protein [Falsiroseomonas ponticola]|jgi:flagellar biosynthesis protein FlhG|uniref:nucleotide-binding protein n=1 Tax=Falsiroseomonas ponticola TaxID=2786951 RepID=UPI001933D9E3|nr:cellulose synthase operon protein YhjQ/BcsQ [Roseomonas ponticola]